MLNRRRRPCQHLVSDVSAGLLRSWGQGGLLTLRTWPQGGMRLHGGQPSLVVLEMGAGFQRIFERALTGSIITGTCKPGLGLPTVLKESSPALLTSPTPSFPRPPWETTTPSWQWTSSSSRACHVVELGRLLSPQPCTFWIPLPPTMGMHSHQGFRESPCRAKGHIQAWQHPNLEWGRQHPAPSCARALRRWRLLRKKRRRGAEREAEAQEADAEQRLEMGRSASGFPASGPDGHSGYLQ